MYHARISIFKNRRGKERKRKRKKKKTRQRRYGGQKRKMRETKVRRKKKQTHGVAMSQSGTSDVRGTGGSFPGRNL